MKDNWKRNSAQIKKLAASKAAPSASDIDSIPRVPHKKKVVTSVLPDRNNQGKKISKHKYYQRYCVLCKKSVMPERKFKSHISEECFWRRFYQESIKEGLGKILVNNNKDVKNFQKSKKKCKRELKYIKKQNYIYSMVMSSSTRCELKKIKKVRAKVSNNNELSSISRYRSDSDSSRSSEI